MNTVLVVEDSPAAREMVMRILRREGYNVVGASDGWEGLDKVRREHPDLVLLDLMMPGMDGMTMLAKLRERPASKDLPVILLTALSDEARVDRARELGVREYLVKTRFSYDDLVSRVGRHLQH